MNQETLVATSFSGNCVQKYTRSDVNSLEWAKETHVEVKRPVNLICICGNVYVGSSRGAIFMIDQEFKDKEVIFENKEKKFTRIENFNDKLCILIADSKEILRFYGKERLKDIEISEKVGKAHTICSSGVLLISGDKGFLIYDKNLKNEFKAPPNGMPAQVQQAPPPPQRPHQEIQSRTTGPFVTHPPKPTRVLHSEVN